MSPFGFPSRVRLLGIVVLLTSVTLAGCLGGDDTSTGTSPTPTVTAEPSPSDDPDYDDLKKNESGEQERLPEAHYHHYWGNPPAPVVRVFEGDVSIDFDACLDATVEQEPPCIGAEPTIGSVVFDLEDDGSQVSVAGDAPHLNGHSDTIFTGTSHLEVEFTWDPASQPLIGHEFVFYYKAANSALFLPQEGIPVTPEDPKVIIPVRSGMSDPAHQIWISRWEFMLVANSGPQADWPFPFFLSNGTVGVTMDAYNGFDPSIDPPHPDFWEGTDTLAFGTMTGSFNIQSVAVNQDTPAGSVRQAVVQGSGHDDIAMPVRSIVPAGTEYLQVKVWVNTTDQASQQFDWALKWHGANTEIYSVVTDYEEADGARVYTITTGDDVVDTPYVKESGFRFGIVPRIDAADLTGTGLYDGEYAMSFEAVKKPGFTYYF